MKTIIISLTVIMFSVGFTYQYKSIQQDRAEYEQALINCIEDYRSIYGLEKSFTDKPIKICLMALDKNNKKVVI